MDFTLFLYVLFIMGFSQAHRAAFLPAVSGIVGKGLEREIMRPFLCLRRFGAHSETPFSSPFFRRTAFFPAVSGMVGKGLERETLLPFPRLRRFGTHCETGSKFLLLFSIKSKKESFCFAKIVLNWRISDVVQAKYLARMSPIGACAANLDAPAPLFHSPKS